MRCVISYHRLQDLLLAGMTRCQGLVGVVMDSFLLLVQPTLKQVRQYLYTSLEILLITAEKNLDSSFKKACLY